MDVAYTLFVAFVVYFGAMAVVAVPILMLNQSLPVVAQWLKRRRSKT